MSSRCVSSCSERLSGYAARPGWEVVLGDVKGETAGHAFGVPLAPTTRWWASMANPLPEDFTTPDASMTS
ncbi:hypothetical protein [Streptomyces himastatinicus]|nr:hypothetical protein [Streptomyces himastatinicus]